MFVPKRLQRPQSESADFYATFTTSCEAWSQNRIWIFW
jgi:hypothetical protein